MLRSYRAGRLTSTASRVIVSAGYGVCFVLQAPLYLFAAAPEPYDLLTVGAKTKTANYVQEEMLTSNYEP